MLLGKYNKTQHYHPLKHKEADEVSPCREQGLAEAGHGEASQDKGQ